MSSMATTPARAALVKPLIAALGVAAIAAGVLELASPSPARLAVAPAAHVDSDVYVLDDPVLADLAGGGYAVVTVGLALESGLDRAEAQTGVVREIVTKDLTGIGRSQLLNRDRREALKRRLARDIRSRTDIKLDGVLLTDLTLR
jgi:hypothetical protein